MNTRAMTLLCLAVCALSAWAAPAFAERFTGELTGTNVYVRSNSRDSAYPCTKLSMPAQVTVVGHVPGWYKILPPPGVFSVISRQYVQADEAATSGTVTGDNVWVRAGGELRNEDFWSLQTQLNRGDKVQITGTVGEYYRIVPPAEAYFWISDRYVKPVGAADTAASAPAAAQPSEAAPPAATTAPASGPAPVAAAPTTHPAATTAPASQQQLAAAMERYQAAEADLRAEFQKPPEDRSYDPLIARFKAIDVPQDSNLTPYIEYWISYLEMAKQRRVEAAEFRKVLSSAEARRREYDLKRTAIEVGKAQRQPVLYSAKGVLQPSVIYTGGAAAPKRYVLRNPDTGAVEAYAQCTTGEVRLESYAGQLVGVLGDTRYVPELRAVIVEAQAVSILDQEVSLPAPPRPTVQPLPPPPPVTTTRPASPPVAPEAAETPADEPQPQPAPPEQEEPAPQADPQGAGATPDFDPAEAIAAAPVESEMAADDESVAAQPATRPAAPAGVVVSKPLPPTGLPVVKPTTQPAGTINEEEYN